MDAIEQAVIDVKAKLSKLKEVFALILYGSVSRGDYSIRHSDINFLVVLEDLKAKDKIDKIISDASIKHRVKIHPEYQAKDIKDEDQTLLCKMFEEGEVLYSRGFLFMDKEKLGLNAFRLYRFNTKEIDKTSRVLLSRALHGRNKNYKGLIDDISIIDSGKGGLLVRKDKFKDIERLFNRLSLKYKIKKTVYS